MSERVTVIIGAGLPLNLDIPHDDNYPSTTNITNQVCMPYPDYINYKKGEEPDTEIVNDIRTYLQNNYPCANANNTSINFEQIFHCMESYISYHYAWQKDCHNVKMCPVFAPFTEPAIQLNTSSLNGVMEQFLLRIMDIVHKYDEYFSSEVNGKEKWLADFFKGLPLMDVFNFNYDNMIENILGEGNYEDGFVTTNKSNDFKTFAPAKLLNNPRNLSTINHLHGCIDYFHVRDLNSHWDELRLEDWVKYPDYKIVRDKMVGSRQSQPNTQTGETIYNGPIITGLNKTDKLNCIPFDFYHGNLINSITRNHKLLIIGYSFGDSYCNKLIQRMNLIHGEQARVVIIDFWNVKNNKWAIKDYAYSVNQDLGLTLCIYSNQTQYEEAVGSMSPLEKDKLMKSPSRKLMLGIDGFKSAAQYAQEIYDFLNS